MNLIGSAPQTTVVGEHAGLWTALHQRSPKSPGACKGTVSNPMLGDLWVCCLKGLTETPANQGRPEAKLRLTVATFWGGEEVDDRVVDTRCRFERSMTPKFPGREGGEGRDGRRRFINKVYGVPHGAPQVQLIDQIWNEVPTVQVKTSAYTSDKTMVVIWAFFFF